MAQAASRAYDLDLFQPRKPHLVELKNTKKATEDNRRRSRRQSVLNLIVYLAIAALAVVLVGYFITCNVQLTEMNKALSDKQSQLSALQSEAVRLKSEMAGKTSAEKVNAYVQENGLNPKSIILKQVVKTRCPSPRWRATGSGVHGTPSSTLCRKTGLFARGVILCA